MTGNIDKQRTAARLEPKRGEIWLVNFDPGFGAEIQKARPALVVSVDGLGLLELKTVVPLLTWREKYAGLPWIVRLRGREPGGLAEDSGADTFQVKSVSYSRFIKRLGAATSVELKEVVSGVALCVGFDLSPVDS